MKFIYDHRHELDAEEAEAFQPYEVTPSDKAERFRIDFNRESDYAGNHYPAYLTLQNGKYDKGVYAPPLGPWTDAIDVYDITLTPKSKEVVVRLSFAHVGVMHPAKGRVHGGQLHLTWEPEVTGRCLPEYLQEAFSDMERLAFKRFPQFKPGKPIVPGWRKEQPGWRKEQPKRRPRRKS